MKVTIQKKKVTEEIEEVEVEVTFPHYLRLRDTSCYIALLSETEMVRTNSYPHTAYVEQRNELAVNYIGDDQFEPCTEQEFTAALSKAYTKITETISPILSVNV